MTTPPHGEGELYTMQPKDYERLGILSAQMGNLVEAVTVMNEKLDKMNDQLLSKSEAAVMFQNRDIEIANLRRELTEVKAQRKDRVANTVSVIAVIIAGATFVLSYLN